MKTLRQAKQLAQNEGAFYFFPGISTASDRCRWNSLTLRKLQISSQNWGLSALLTVKQWTKCRYTHAQNLRVLTYLALERIHKSGLVTKLCPTLVTIWTVAHQAPLSMGFPRARILGWVAISSFRRSSQPRDQTWASWFPALAGRFFTNCTNWEALTVCSK